MERLSEPSPRWYGTSDAIRIADNVLLYQRASGGWSKNTEMASLIEDTERDEIVRQKSRDDSTIDNGATYGQLTFLARVYGAAQLPRHRQAFLQGIDYLLGAQYDNGGWPQFYPRLRGYSRHITFNDNAMVGVLRLLRNVARTDPPYRFVDEPRRARAREAVLKGTECILKCQIVVNGRRTVWCAQHHEETLKPASARSTRRSH